MKKTFIYLVFVLVFVNLCSALIVENPLPIITTTFNEKVKPQTVEAELTDWNQEPIYIELINSSNNKTFQYQPTTYLEEGDYVFTIQAEDIYGNPGQIKTKPFTLTVPALSISLYSPFFGVAPNNPYDISIKTTLPSNCRYAIVPKDYEDMTSSLKTNTSFIHTIQNFDLSETNQIYFACFSNYKNETASNDFSFSMDTENPIIQTITADDVAEFPLESELYVKTDKETICAYSKNSTEFNKMTLFENTNIEDSSSYTLTHTHLLDENDLEDFTTNSFYVVCKALSSRKTESKKIDIEVFSQSEAKVKINSPKNDNYYPAGSVNFSLETNKLSRCHFSQNQSQITGSGGTFGTFTKDHQAELQLSEGTYKYYFQCLVNTPEGLLDPISTQFTLDATSPYINYVDDSNQLPGLENLSEFTYQTDKLFLKISAYDNESGISGYNYSLLQDNSNSPDSDKVIVNWTFFESDDDLENIEVDNLDLKDTFKYYFKVKAKNNAGIWSPEKTSNGITVKLDLGNLGYCYNGIKDNTESDVDCGGQCKKCSLGKSCNINADCQSNFCDPNTQTCENSSSCNNGILDSGESDVDCGGPCQPCAAGYSCTQDSDCQSNFCDPTTKLCVNQDTCTNNIKDQDESDVDCGINCPPCQDGKSCSSDFDCLSGFCNEDGICKGQSSCGNNEFNLGEQCDGSTSLTCQDFTFESGTLSCDSSCLIDTSSCQDIQGECGDGIINPGEQCDGSAMPDLHCFDFGNYESGTLSCNNCILSLESCTTDLDPLQDTDQDGMPDKYELKYFNCRTCADPLEDPDNDQLTNQEESSLCARKGTDPHSKDTDGDGYTDKEEKEKMTDPCDLSDYPESSLMFILIIIFIFLLILTGAAYYLYTKKSLLIINKAPYIKLNPKVKTFNDLFNGPPAPKQQPQHKDYKPPQQTQPKPSEKPQQTQPKQQPQEKEEPKISKRRLERQKRRQELFSKLTGSKENKEKKKEKRLKPLELKGHNKEKQKQQKVNQNKLDSLPKTDKTSSEEQK
jgi:flagellar basal body-associated protein FliL